MKIFKDMFARWYTEEKNTLWFKNDELLKTKVPKLITEVEYEEITGKKYEV
ncbi:MAG: XkdX family protein [Anaerovoracaceae bacterium]